jgi:hypothetical protein
MDYATVTDWVAYLRDCLSMPGAHPEMDPDNLNVDAGLSRAQAEVEGTPYAVRIAEAALDVLEHGTDAEQRELLQLAFTGVPNVGRRIATVARTWRGGPLDDCVSTLLLRGLQAAPTDPAILAGFADEVALGGKRAISALKDVAPHNAAWVAAHVGALDARVDPKGAGLFWLAARVGAAQLPRLVAAIVGAGPDHVDRFLAGLIGLDAPPHLLAALRPVMATFPAFAGRVP